MKTDTRQQTSDILRCGQGDYRQRLTPRNFQRSSGVLAIVALIWIGLILFFGAGLFWVHLAVQAMLSAH